MVRAGLGIIAGFLVLGGSAEGAVLIDFGAAGNQTTSEALTGTERFWNNVTDVNQPFGAAAPMALINTDQSASGILLKVSNTETTTGTNVGKGFMSANVNGLDPSTGAALARGYPASVTMNTLYGATVATAGFPNPTGNVIITLTGMGAGQTYNFFGTAARTGSTTNREELLTFQGQGAPVTKVFQPGNNTAGNIFSSGNVIADATGQITLTLSPTANNATPEKFFYISALEIQPVPEPASLGVIFAGGVVLLARRRR
jgi:hypothetical protein